MRERTRNCTRRRLLTGAAGTAGLLGLGTATGATEGRVADLLADADAGDALRVGAGKASMAWRVGAKPGQVGTGAGTSLDRDPYPYSTIAEPSDGVHSEPTAKAVVLESGGERYALVKADTFLMHEHLHRRVSDLVAGTGIPREHILLSATHNHSAPHTTSSGVAVAAFTDAFDVRHWSYQTRQLATAIERAVETLEPATARAVEGTFDDVQENIIGPAVATEKAHADGGPLDAGNTDDYDELTDEDGEPVRAGFPHDHFEDQFVVLRFDTPDGDPIAATATLGMHPESLAGGHGLVTGEFLGTLERRLEAHVGGDFLATFLNGALGDVEPSRGNVGQPDWWRESFGRLEEMADQIGREAVRLYELAGDAPIPGPGGAPGDTPDAPGDGGPVDAPGGTQGSSGSDAAGPSGTGPGGVVASPDRTAGPHRRPNQLADGDETVLAYGRDVDVGMTALRLAPPEGEPGPTSSYLSQQVGSGLEMPSTGAAQESASPFLGAFALGDLLLSGFPGEPISDVSFSFRTRVVEGFDDVYQGYHWPGNPEWVRDRIGENFSGSGLEGGFEIAALCSMGNAWQGYFVTRWEYENRNHYRESLTPYGPDSADYVTSALVDMAAELRGERTASSRLSAVEAGDSGRREAVYRALVAAEQSVRGYRASIPPAGEGVGDPVAQSDDVGRFEIATFAWIGGSNAVDLPRASLDRRDGGRWVEVAGGAGHEVVVRSDHPRLYEEPRQLPAREREWRAAWKVPWDAPAGTYRLRVAGVARGEPGSSESTFFDPAGANVAYEVVSEPFAVDGGAIPLSLEYTSLAREDGRVVGRLAFEAPFRAVDRPADGTEITVRLEGETTVETTATYDVDGFALDAPVPAGDVTVVVDRRAWVDDAGNPTERVEVSV